MTKNSRNKGENGNNRRKDRKAWHADLRPETKKSAFAVFAFMGAALLALSYIGKGGSAGNGIFNFLNYLLGRGYFFAPLAFILIGFSALFSEKRKILATSLAGGALFLLACLAIIQILFADMTGGVVGYLISLGLLKLFDFWAGLTIAVGFLIISLLLVLNIPLKFSRTSGEESKELIQAAENGEPSKAVLSEIGTMLKSAMERKKEEVPAAAASPASEISVRDKESDIQVRKIAKKLDYKKPPLDLLQGDRGTPSSGDIRANSNVIKRTLENFGVEVEMAEVSIGPTVTQYTLKPAEGVKLSRITALHNDLSLALAAHPIRIEAPIPGKSLVGIEVPNRSIALVGLRALLEHKIFQETANPLLIALGRDVTGSPVFADLARMPHLLISGATGSGKSVSAHSVLTSLLYRNPPEMVRFILVDPKRVELSVYNNIPHLLTPVITDPKKTIHALRWAAKEMDRRYELLSQNNVRDIVGFNSQASKNGEDFLPYIVIMIDELADLMAMFPREVEASIIRLAQMARAIGIHLIVATQRPSVEVITGLIKANITSRIAFQVASQIDSRTVLDMSGAEKLLGNGDMLFLAGDTSKPKRIQGSFVSEQEIKRVVGFLREETDAPDYDEAIIQGRPDDDNNSSGDFSGDEDPLYDEATDIVKQAGRASASYLQRRLRVGYARAARLLDLMESAGVIGPPDGAKPREVLSGRENSENEGPV